MGLPSWKLFFLPFPTAQAEPSDPTAPPALLQGSCTPGFALCMSDLQSATEVTLAFVGFLSLLASCPCCFVQPQPRLLFQNRHLVSCF